ncbi:MAG TPA: protein phosphatase 2C domain-containing protein [Acidimicrobiales bacterium]|nr:protein phosphatase 2C domain-containing protein [Acidimicrobiales bacterium]
MSTSTDAHAEVAPCRACGSPVFDDESFCEACGSKVTPEADVPVPASPASKAARPVARREAHDLGVLGAVTDIGYRRSRNEDAVAIAVTDGCHIAAVCDGVSSTAHGDRAAHAATTAALATLQRALEHPGRTAGADLEALMGDAFDEAQQAVLLVPSDDDPLGNVASPSTTLVVAITTPERVVVGNTGDSRAYLLSADPSLSRLLTIDDSWAQERIAEGTRPEEAYEQPGAHVITRWIGGGTESWAPRVTDVEVDGPGLVVLCTDGVWNSFEEPARLEALVPDGTPSPIEVAHALADAALEAGGRDNMAIAIIPVGRTLPNARERSGS